MENNNQSQTPESETQRYWTIVFPGECGQHVQETWSEKQIIASAWYRNWIMMMVQADKAHLMSDEAALDDWKVVHWAQQTDQWGNTLVGPKTGN
jgi:hypothetical protein